MKSTTLLPLLLSLLLLLLHPSPTDAATSPFSTHTDPFQLPIPSTPLTLLLSGWTQPSNYFTPLFLYDLADNAQSAIVAELLSATPPPTAPSTPNLEWCSSTGTRRLCLRLNHNPFESGLTWTDIARVVEALREGYGAYTDFRECARISVVHAGRGEVASGELVVKRVRLGG